MCRWLAYAGKEIFLEELIENPINSLIKQSLNASESKTAINGDGFGLGWYGRKETPGIYREILPAWADQNLLSLCQQISSGLFFAHVRASTGTFTSRANCHPFRFGHWMFMHNGQIAEYDKVRRDLENLIPDEYYIGREGTTDSEALFLALFAFGLNEDPIAAVSKLCNKVNQLMQNKGIKAAFRFTATLSDGQHIYAFRYSSDCRAPSLYYRCNGSGVVIASEPLDVTDADWKMVEPGHGLKICAKQQPEEFKMAIADCQKLSTV
ncbi:MAG: glutamine amidotransferase class-II domain protein [Osedax symbiont Rs2]|nr:MAG: glutamine amidotransferase class-II domain protein [Osedax symbiont Rs2]